MSKVGAILLMIISPVLANSILAQNNILNQNCWFNQEFASMARLSNGNIAVGWYSSQVGAPALYANVFATDFAPVSENEFPISKILKSISPSLNSDYDIKLSILED
jgi:hypothetical protein